MNNIAKLDKNKREFIFKTSAFNMGVNPVIIEKDYWVCLILYFLFKISSFKSNFIFKGGTSLSKCYQVINRFSEDIDLILTLNSININEDDLFIDRSKTQDQKFSDSLNKLCASYIKNTFISLFTTELEKYLAYKVNIEINPEDNQTVYIYYPSIYSTEYIKPIIKLEIGPIALNTPIEQRNVTPYVYKDFANQFLISTFAIPVVCIERTFYEKLLILSNEINRPLSKKMPLRYSRHYYDVYMIYNSEYFKRVLNNKTLFNEVKQFKKKYYNSGWSKYEETNLNEIKLVPPAERMNELLQDYTNMKEMFFTKVVSFDEIVKTLYKIEKIFSI